MPILIAIISLIIALAVGAYVFFRPMETPLTEEVMPVFEIRDEIETTFESDEIIPEDATPEPISANLQSGPSGTFSASASYLTPARTEHAVAVSVTLTDGIVTNSSVTYDGRATGSYSNDNQNRFDQAYQSQVVGKRLEEINLARVGGASLTSGAYNEAIRQIITEV